jgi:cystathionine beta-lyase/cystathionine gamma-synthase
MKTATRCVHHETDEDAFGAVVPPIYQTATFRQPTALELGELSIGSQSSVQGSCWTTLESGISVVCWISKSFLRELTILSHPSFHRLRDERH